MNENKDIKTSLPKLRFPEFVNDREWRNEMLGNISEIITGNTPSTSDQDNYGGDIMFVSPADISNSRYVAKSKLSLSEKGYSKTRHVKENSVMFVCIGSTIGKIAQNKFNCATNQQINSVAPYDQYSNDFVYSSLEYYATEIASNAGRHAIPIINKSTFSAVSIYFPEPDEQQKIADCISSLDDVISGVSDKIVALKEYKKGLMQQLFPAEGKTTPAYRFPEFQNDGVWLETTLIKLAKFRRGSFPQPYGLPEWYDDNGMPFIQVYDVDNNLRLKPQTKSKISSIAAKQSVFIPKETVIVTIQGSIGRVAVTQYDAYIDRTLLLFEEFYKPINKTFIAYVLQLLFEIEKEKAPGGIIKTITKEALSSFIILLPKIDEQNRIANCIESIDNLIEAENNHLDQLKSHKNGLMQQLFPNLN